MNNHVQFTDCLVVLFKASLLKEKKDNVLNITKSTTRLRPKTKVKKLIDAESQISTVSSNGKNAEFVLHMQ